MTRNECEHGQLRRSCQICDLVEERDAAVQQAQIWKQEAHTQAATVAEIYQLCTGNTGEPGNWHGAEPVRKLVAERNALAEHAVWLENELEEPAHMQADAYRQAVDRIHPYVGAGRLPASLDASLCCLIHAFDERDALAAHVERLSVWIRGCGWHDDSCAIFDTDDEDGHCACDCGLAVAYDTPDTSLAKRDAEQQKIGAASFRHEIMESVQAPFRPHIQGVFEAWLRRQTGGDA